MAPSSFVMLELYGPWWNQLRSCIFKLKGHLTKHHIKHNLTLQKKKNRKKKKKKHMLLKTFSAQTKLIFISYCFKLNKYRFTLPVTTEALWKRFCYRQTNRVNAFRALLPLSTMQFVLLMSQRGLTESYQLYVV